MGEAAGYLSYPRLLFVGKALPNPAPDHQRYVLGLSARDHLEAQGTYGCTFRVLRFMV